MSSAIIALVLAGLVGWLLRRPAADANTPDGELWQAFDRGEDPTGDE